MITLKTFNKNELREFVDTDQYKSFDFLPITKHRALAQIQNPIIEENDVLLTLAFEDEKLAGYLGTYPSVFFIENEIIKYAWLSTLYVNENFRGKRIAQKLLEKVFEKYDGKIAITEFTPEAENLYNKTKQFEYINPKLGQRFYFRSDIGEIITRKKPEISFLKPIFKSVDTIVNSLISIKKSFSENNTVNYEITDFVDSESIDFLNHFSKNRTGEELNVIIKNPWVLEGKTPEKNYQFSNYSNEFKYFWVKIFDQNNKLQTCSLLLLRDGHLKISYLFSENNLEPFAKFLQNFIGEKKIKLLTSYQTELNEILSKKSFSKLYQKKIERRYLFHKKMIEILPENFKSNFQDGDGDCVFT